MKNEKTLTPSSPVPLYHQIAQQIRDAILRGELNHGDHLAPLREAAERWDVNFHTVRHAYAELAREGLVEIRGPRGTRVIASIKSGSESPFEPQSPEPESVKGFIRQVVGQAESNYGLSIAALLNQIKTLGDNPIDRVYVFECSQYQCEDLCRQIEEIWSVEAIPYCLDASGDLPTGHLIATYFHYNEIRLRWPKKLASFSFISIAPGRPLIDRLQTLPPHKKILTVCEMDDPTALAVIADVSAVLSSKGYEIGSCILSAATSLPTVGKNELLLLPPRIWGALDVDARADSSIVEVRYFFDRDELNQLASEVGWAGATDLISRSA